MCTGKLEIRAGGPGTFASCFGQECDQADIAQAVDPDGRKPAAPDPAWHAEVEQRQADEERKRDKLLEAVRQRFDAAEPATDIPEYLTAKGYDWMPSGIARRLCNGITLVPMYRPGKVTSSVPRSCPSPARRSPMDRSPPARTYSSGDERRHGAHLHR